MSRLDHSIYLKMFSALPVGVFLVDDKKVICEWNTWLVKRTKVSRKKALGSQLEDLFPEVSTERFQFAVNQVLAHEHPQVLSQILNHYLIPIPLPKVSQTKHLKYMQQSVSLFPIVTADKTYAMVVILDVTENYNQRHMLLHVAKRFEEESVRDELTGLYNRRFLWEYLESELPKASREKYTLVCTMYDLDHFKAVNDDVGHKAGDEVLRSFVEVIKGCMRAGDRAFRYGGEEFITISSHVNPKQGGVLAERIRKKLAAKKMHGSVKRKMTCSAGYATAKPLFVPLSSESLIKHADEALYEAKTTGRNRVCTYGMHVQKDKLKLVDFEYVHKIARRDEALQAELYAVFLEEATQQASDLKKIFASEDVDQVVAVMHSLKASAKAVGANPLGDAAESIEFAARAADFEKINKRKAVFLELLADTLKAIESYLG